MKCTLVGAEVGRALKAVASICASNRGEGPPPLGGIAHSFITNGVYFTLGEGGKLSIWVCDMKRIIVWFPVAHVEGDLGTWVMAPKQALSLAETARVLQKDVEVRVDNDGPFEVSMGGAELTIPFAKGNLPPYELSRSYPEQDRYALHAIVNPSALSRTLGKFKVRRNNGSIFTMTLPSKDPWGKIVKGDSEAEHRVDVISPPPRTLRANFVHGYMQEAVDALCPMNPERLQVSYGDGIPLRLHPDGFPNLQAYVWRSV